MKPATLTYLWREMALLSLFAYVVLLGGGFAALIDIRLQAFSLILASGVFGAWLLHSLLKKERLHRSGLELALLLFIGSQIIAVLFSEDPRRSLPHSITWLVYVLALYLVLDLLRKGWPAELIEKCLLIAGAMVIGFGLVELAGVYFSWRAAVAGLEFAPTFQQRISGFLGDPNLLAAFTNLIIPLAVARALVSGKLSRTLLFGLALAGVIVLFFADSRGGFLSFGTAMVILAALWITVVSAGGKRQALKLWKYVSARKTMFFLLAVAAIAAAGILAWQVFSFQGDTTHAPALTARNIYWQAAGNAVVEDPLTGVGPGLYPVTLMQIWSTPPARPYLHAHSLPFQIAAESGLLGLVALGFLAAAIGNRAWGAWRSLDYGGCARWAAALAALVGLGVHSLVDDFFPFPAVGVSAMVLLAFVMPVSKGKSKAGGISQLWLGVPALAAAVFTGYALAAYSHADRGISLGEIEDWGAAASEVDTAAQSDNRSAFYWLQAGFVYARLGETDSGYYDESIASYQRGIGLEPQYALNHANLGSLFWTSGQQSEGLAQMRIATALAPEAWLFWLNQGIYEETLGYLEEAESSFHDALALFPEIAGAQFWQKSEFRQTTLDTFEPPLAAETTRAQAVAAADAGRRSIVSGDLAAARELLVQAYELNDQEVSVYVGLAELAFANGDFEEAEQFVNVALLIQATSTHSKAESVLLAAEIALAKGESEVALQRYQVAYGAILSDTSYGWGSAGWSPYAWFVFQRRAFPEDLVPQLVRADITTSIAERLLVLAELYESAGFSDEAQSVRAELQPYLSSAN